MRSGHLGRGAWLAWTILCTWMCVTSVHAQSAVVCAGFDDAELLARIRGQTRDLPISLSSSPSTDLSHPSAAQLQAVAREQSADFVVSVDQDSNGARTVYVFDARAGELRVRAAPAPDRKHRFARSAAAETVALIVRGELSDALAARESEQREAGRETTPITETPPDRAGPPPASSTSARDVTSQPVTRSTPNKAPEKPATQSEASTEEPEEEEPEEEEPEPEPEPEPDSTTPISLGPLTLSLELAGRASTPIDERYFLGAAISLRVSLDYFSLGVTGNTTLADRREIQGLALTLREHGIGIEALAHLPLTAAFRLGLGVAGRFLFYRRSTESGNAEWNPEPANTSSTIALGPQAELRWQLVEHLGLSVRFGLDVLLRPVSWRYRLDTNQRDPIELERQNRTEPWLSVGVYGSL